MVQCLARLPVSYLHMQIYTEFRAQCNCAIYFSKGSTSKELNLSTPQSELESGIILFEETTESQTDYDCCMNQI